jgi:hypothetical protein
LFGNSRKPDDPDVNRVEGLRAQGPWWQSLWAMSLAALLAIAVVLGVATAANAFGENIHGKVYCADGPVTGVFIESSFAPRAWDGGPLLQSGPAEWWQSAEPNSAEFEYWLPVSSSYSIHFGCGSLPVAYPGTWATDNRTPYVDGTDQAWWCDNPANTGTTTILNRRCRSN